MVVDVERRCGLLDDAVLHHDDRVAHRHRFRLVVSDVDRRHAEFTMHLGEEAARLDAQLRVEVGQRLVHQEDARAAHHRARQRDTLALAARKGLGQAVEKLSHPQPFGDALDLLVDVALRHFRIFRPKAMLSNTFRCGKSA